MEGLIKKIEYLAEKQKNWYTQKYDDLLKGEFGNEFCNVLDEVKDSIINNGESETFKILEKYITDDNQHLLSDIKSVVRSNLIPYYACRILQNKIKDGSLTIMQIRYLFNEIFERYIIRYDRNYEGICNEIGISIKEFNNIAEAFKGVAYKGITGRFSRESMNDLFQQLTGMEGKYAEIFAELYDVNYKELQTLYIIDNIY